MDIKLPYFRKIELRCKVCNKEFFVKPSHQTKRKCCSKLCSSKYKSELYKGRKMTEEWKNKISESKKGKKHPLWKGNRVGYTSLHQWVIREKGKANRCLFCESVKNVEWANRNHKYERCLNDWMPLCKKCHWKYDQANWGIASKLFIKLISGGLGKRIT